MAAITRQTERKKLLVNQHSVIVKHNNKKNDVNTQVDARIAATSRRGFTPLGCMSRTLLLYMLNM